MNEFDEKMHFYRQRRARNISLAVMGYFIAVVCLIGCTVLWSAPIAGVLMLLLIIACSTGLIIYTNMSTPLEFSSKYQDDYNYEEYAERYDGSYDDGYKTRDVSTETTDGSSASGEGASGANGSGPFGGAGGAGGNSQRPDSRYYMNRRPTSSARMFKQIMEIFWIGVTIVYFVVSFIFGRWGITWLIWLIGAALDRAIRILWEARRFDGPSDKR